MLPERKPGSNKIQGIIFMLLGGTALSFGAFLFAVPIGFPSTFRVVFSLALMAYGTFRLLSGVGVIRRSIEDENERREAEAKRIAEASSGESSFKSDF